MQSIPRMIYSNSALIFIAENMNNNAELPKLQPNEIIEKTVFLKESSSMLWLTIEENIGDVIPHTSLYIQTNTKIKKITDEPPSPNIHNASNAKHTLIRIFSDLNILFSFL